MTSVAVLALCFNSCKEKNKPEPEPEPQPVVEATLAITVDSILYTELDFTVTPSDTAKTYLCTYFTPAEVEGKTEAQIQAMIKEEIDDYIAYLLANDTEASYEDFLRKGKKSFYFSELTPGANYNIYAAYMDAEGKISGKLGVASTSTVAPVPPTGEVVDLGALTAVYFEDWRDYDGSWTMYFDNETETKELALTIFSDTLGGNFSIADLDPDYSYVWIEDVQEAISFQSIAVTSNVSADGKTANFAGNVVAYNGIKFTFSATADLAELLGDDSVDGDDDDDDDPGWAPRRRVSKKAVAPKKIALRK